MDCIDLFKRAAMALQTDPRYVILDQARKANDKDEELQNLIGEFNLARMDLNNEIGKNERDDDRAGAFCLLHRQLLYLRRLPLSRVFIGTRLCNTDRVLFAPAVTARKPADGTIQGKEEKPWQSFRP